MFFQHQSEIIECHRILRINLDSTVKCGESKCGHLPSPFKKETINSFRLLPLETGLGFIYIFRAVLEQQKTQVVVRYDEL